MLALAGGGALAAGVLTLVGIWNALSRSLPFALLVVVSAAIVGSLAVREGLQALDGTIRSASTPSGSKVAPTETAPGAYRTSGLKHEASRAAGPRSGIGRAAVSASAHVGDDFWRRWMLPGAGSLGAELIGPVPETAYLPPRPGAVAPYSARDQDLIFAPAGSSVGASSRRPIGPEPAIDRGRPATPSANAPPHPGDRALPTVGVRPFSEEELDRLFPIDARSPEPGPLNGPQAPGPVLGEAPPSSPLIAQFPVGPVDRRATALPSSPPGEGTPEWRQLIAVEAMETTSGMTIGDFAAPFSSLMGVSPPMDLMDHPLHREAVNPIPPHLRPAPGVDLGGRSGGEVERPVRTVEDRSCTMCARQLWDFRSWGDCPGCGDPICELCLRLSFLTGAEGHCFDCRDAPEWPAT